MRRWREAVQGVAAALVVGAGLLALPAQTHAAAPATLSGTYLRLHVDKIPEGRRVDVLVAGGRGYALQLPPGSRVRSGAQVQITGAVGGSAVAATGVQEISPPPAA